LVIRAFFNVLFRSLELWTFQRYPVTKEDTYWIDGIYNGGKFASGYGASLYIIGLMPVDGCKVCGINISKQSF
jgi:hypothetical protein